MKFSASMIVTIASNMKSSVSLASSCICRASVAGKAEPLGMHVALSKTDKSRGTYEHSIIMRSGRWLSARRHGEMH